MFSFNYVVHFKRDFNNILKHRLKLPGLGFLSIDGSTHVDGWICMYLHGFVCVCTCMSVDVLLWIQMNLHNILILL